VTDIERRLDHPRSNGIEPVHVVLDGGGRRLSSICDRSTEFSSSSPEVPQDP
jgi:hypothetical protein